MASAILYTDLAEFYDALFGKPAEQIQRDTTDIQDIAEKHHQETPVSLLDVSCGTGTHITRLSSQYDCLGLDYNREMLTIADSKTDDTVTLIQGDMWNLPVHADADITTLLFDAALFADDEAELTLLFSEIYTTVAPGGVALIEAFTAPTEAAETDAHDDHGEEDPSESQVLTATNEGTELEVTQTMGVEDGQQVMAMDYTVTGPDGQQRRCSEEFRFTLFGKQQILDAARAAGFTTVTHYPDRLSHGVFACEA